MYARRENSVVNEEVILQALSRLKLTVEPFDPISLQMRLSEESNLKVSLKFINTPLDALGYTMSMKHHVLPGGIAYNAVAGRPELYIYSGLEAWEQDETYYYCLAHLLLGHALPVSGVEQRWGDQVTEVPAMNFWSVPEPIVYQKPPVCMERCRIDLDERTRYLSWAQVQAMSAVGYLQAQANQGRSALSRMERLLGIRES